MNERTKRIVTMVLAFACVAGAVMTVVSYLDSQESQKAYEMAIALASMPTETVIPVQRRTRSRISLAMSNALGK